MLEKGVSLVRTPEPAQQGAQELGHPNGAIATSITTEQPIETSPDLLSIDEPEPDDETSPSATDQSWGRAIKITLPILGACAALGVALAAGFILHSPLSPWNRGAIADAGDPKPLDAPESEFASYMQRALDTIASSEKTGNSLGDGSGNSSGNGSDSNFPGASDNDSFRSSGIPQRVYIPVYQPPSPSVSALPNVPVQSGLASAPTVNTSPTLPTPPAPVALAPAVPSTPVPSTPSVPAPAPAPQPSNSSTPVTSEFSHEHVLVGLLQLGDRSVAMFDFSEGTHRVKVGEQIGDSGWSLVSVSQNEAVIRRNGDVRSIYIGQSF